MGNNLILLAGHTIDARTGRGTGAHGLGYDEAKLAISFRDDLANSIKNNPLGSKIKIIVDEDSIISTPDFIRKVKPTEKDLLVEIHWNAFSNSKANGTEVFIRSSPRNDEIQFAGRTVDLFTRILNTKARGGQLVGRAGVKFEHESQHPRLFIFRSLATSILIETCFITNPKDMKSFISKKEELVLEYSKELISSYNSLSK